MADITNLPPGSGGAAGPSALDSQPVTTFGTYSFPCAYHELDGEQRDHIHEYPHRDGGAPEKLGRKLYICNVRGLFHNKFKAFPNLYPDTINALQVMFEQGTTASFTHPSVGEYPAYIRKWNRRRDPRVRSGEVVDITFMEDQQAQFLVNTLVSGSTLSSVDGARTNLNQQLAAVQSQLQLDTTTTGLFTALQTLSNDVTGISDTASLYGNLVSAKAQELVQLCQQLDAAVPLQDARAFSVVDAIHELWAQAQALVQDSQSQRVQIQTWIVPATMPLTQVSARLYRGDASYADTLAALNVIPDPLEVPAGTVIFYYP